MSPFTLRHWKGPAVHYIVKQIQHNKMTVKMACKWLQERRGTRCSPTVALQYLADARIITGPFFPQVWKKKIILIHVSTHSPYLSHRCFVGNIAGFLTWTTVWRGQPGGDPHLQLLLLPQQPPNFTNHTPAGGEREKVWQLFTQGRRGDDEKIKEGWRGQKQW